MIGWTLGDIAERIGARLDTAGVPAVAGEVVESVVADSREAGPGALFVAIPGERVDGHDFAAQAAGLGAIATLATRPVGTPALIVDDTVAALGRLAAAVRRALPAATVVALTGSSGKTTTKDLLADILAPVGPTVAPRGSYNSEVGLPLTVCSCTPDTRFLVLEMGMRGHGHIAYLCSLVPPDISAVINVGSAHIEMLGSREAIAEAKGEILDALPENGTAVLHADDPLVMAQARRTRARILTFGESAGAEVRATGVVLDAATHPQFTVHVGADQATVRLALVGEHQVGNALAAAAMAHAAGVSFADIVAGLEAARPRSRWRMEVVERPDGVTVVNDAYNANPESMRAALKALVAMSGGQRRTWAVLGEMRELGEHSLEEHDALGRLAVRLDVSRLVVVGEGARPLHLGASLEGSWGNESVWVPDAGAALDLLAAEVRPGDVVLVKASRSIGLDVVARGLLEDRS